MGRSIDLLERRWCHCPRRSPHSISKGTMRMPTLLPFGEGCMRGEAIDTRTRSIRRGSRHGTSERWFVVIGGDPSLVRVAASTSLQGGGQARNRCGIDVPLVAGRARKIASIKGVFLTVVFDAAFRSRDAGVVQLLCDLRHRKGMSSTVASML